MDSIWSLGLAGKLVFWHDSFVKHVLYHEHISVGASSLVNARLSFNWDFLLRLLLLSLCDLLVVGHYGSHFRRVSFFFARLFSVASLFR
jgi:hypothetical protein